MVWEQDLACAYAQLHDTAGVAGAVQYLRAHRADAEIVFEGGLMCAGEADDVAKAVISGIENPDTRSAVLADDQTYLDPPGPQSAWLESQRAAAKAILGRSDVKAAIEKYGRVERYPVTE